MEMMVTDAASDRASVLDPRHRPEMGVARERWDSPLAERAAASIEDVGHHSVPLLGEEIIGYTEPSHHDMGFVFQPPQLTGVVHITFESSGTGRRYAGLTC